MNDIRQPAGRPTGGQFAPINRPDGAPLGADMAEARAERSRLFFTGGVEAWEEQAALTRAVLDLARAARSAGLNFDAALVAAAREDNAGRDLHDDRVFVAVSQLSDAEQIRLNTDLAEAMGRVSWDIDRREIAYQLGLDASVRTDERLSHYGFDPEKVDALVAKHGGDRAAAVKAIEGTDAWYQFDAGDHDGEVARVTTALKAALAEALGTV